MILQILKTHANLRVITGLQPLLCCEGNLFSHCSYTLFVHSPLSMIEKKLTSITLILITPLHYITAEKSCHLAYKMELITV
jgi:hypothetical protein